MKDALTTMNGYYGLGTKALKICNAVPKPKGALTSNTSSSPGNASSYSGNAPEYTQYYDPTTYWQNYTNWQSVSGKYYY